MNGYGKRIRAARAARRLSQSAVARRFGISRNAVSMWESEGSRPDPDKLPRLAEILQVPLGWLMRDNGFESEDVPAAPEPPIPNATAPRGFTLTARRLPVYGRAVGGADGRFVFNGELIDRVACPEGLENAKGAYAVYVSGDSMEPRYFAGETVYVHPGLSPRKGDFVVVQIRSANDGDPPGGYVKQFVSLSATKLTVHQFNPPSDLTFPASGVLSIHKIVFAGSI